MLRPRRGRRFAALVAVLALAVAACGGGDTTDSADDTTVVTTPAPTTTTAPASNNGVFDDSILFGQSAALSGPASELGRSMRLGILAAFEEANTSGGVNGRRLDLQTLDDGYEPTKAVETTSLLIRDWEVFALIGAVGTPTSRFTTPIARSAGVPFIAPFTGAAFLRDTEWDNIVNLRASYGQETEEMVERLTTDLGVTRIGVLYQNDSFGRDGYQGVIDALTRREMEPVSVGIYPRNTTAIKSALMDLRQGEPEAIIMIGAYEPVATLILWAREIQMDPVFMAVSFVGSNALAQELSTDGAGVLVTQVVPFPEQGALPVVDDYLSALTAFAPEADPGFVSLEGYLAGRLAIAALEQCGRNVTRSCLLDDLTSRGAFDINGFDLEYGADDNQGSDSVFLTVIGDDGEYHPVSTLNELSRWVTK